MLLDFLASLYAKKLRIEFFFRVVGGIKKDETPEGNLQIKFELWIIYIRTDFHYAILLKPIEL